MFNLPPDQLQETIIFMAWRQMLEHKMLVGQNQQIQTLAKRVEELQPKEPMPPAPMPADDAPPPLDSENP